MHDTVVTSKRHHPYPHVADKMSARVLGSQGAEMEPDAIGHEGSVSGAELLCGQATHEGKATAVLHLVENGLQGGTEVGQWKLIYVLKCVRIADALHCMQELSNVVFRQVVCVQIIGAILLILRGCPRCRMVFH